ncbi:putative armadillo-like helical, importin beta family [Helianthus annuus]|uniref:Armadillo-like helical, importin beta family n=2 Tax=Helianthus annuus TaxID=4232 RepID=A0A251VGJ2_HELAN|nr:putative armadillo-like helical, importin beta family [Helianthus annuus]
MDEKFKRKRHQMGSGQFQVEHVSPFSLTCRVQVNPVRDELVMKTAIGVLGDLADTLGSKAGLLIQQSLLSKVFLNECFSSEDNLIKEAAEWTK